MTNSIPSNARLLLWASVSFLLVIAALLSTFLVYQARTGTSTEPVTQAEVDMAQPFWTITGYALLVPAAASGRRGGWWRSTPTSRTSSPCCASTATGSADPVADPDGFLRKMERLAALGIEHVQLRNRTPDPVGYVTEFGEKVAPRLAEI